MFSQVNSLPAIKAAISAYGYAEKNVHRPFIAAPDAFKAGAISSQLGKTLKVVL